MKPDLVAVVVRARTGDAEAYGALIDEFQDYAVACALGYGVDWHAAHDVAQEAFLALPAKLPDLRDALAFPLWFRRIIRTFALRHLRGTSRLGLTALVPDQPAAEVRPPVSAQSVDRALQRLSDGQRLVVALQYFGGFAQSEIGAFLDLPVSTVKKRSHDARRHLKEVLAIIESTGRDTAPSRSAEFRQTVLLFSAIRRHDVAQVRRLVQQAPELLEARESWSVEDALAAQLPASGKATPLVRAAGVGSTPLLEVLLDNGADINAVCDCETRESALWAAVEVNSLDCVRLLLARGADPDLSAALGVTPLILAAMRAAPDIIEELLSAGADPALRDAHGRNAGDWQRIRHDAGTGHTSVELHTGIKAIDLLVPLRRGDLVAVASSYGLGLRVLLTELSLRLPGPTTWIVAPSRHHPEGALEAALRELGAASSISVVTLPDQVDIEGQIAAVEQALRVTKPAVLVLFHGDIRNTAFDALLPSLRRSDELDLVLVVQPQQPIPTLRSTAHLPEGFDAVLSLDPRRARANLWPAVDVVRSRSGREDPASPLRELLATYDLLDPELRLNAPETFLAAGDLARRGQAVHRYLTQPFQTAQPHTAAPSAWVSPDQLRSEVTALLLT